MSSGKLTQRQNFILKLLMQKATKQVERGVKKMHPADLADIFYHLPRHLQTLFLDILFSVRLAAPTLNELPDEMAHELLDPIETPVLVQMIGRIPDDDAVDLLQHLSMEKREDVLQALEEKKRFSLIRLMLYAPNTAGGIMTTDVIAFDQSMTVEDTIRKLREEVPSDELFYIYVVDEQNRLVGIISTRALILATPDRMLKDIMNAEVICVETTMTQEEVSREVAKYDLLSIPVVDETHVFQGVITVDDVLDVMEEEATEDIYRLANLDVDEHVFTPVLKSFVLRAPWLLVNLLTAGIAAIVVRFFEGSIQQYASLAVLMPIVAGVSGNSGVQSLTVVVRGLALGEFQTHKGIYTLFKQMWLGLLNGIMVGSLFGVIAYIVSGSQWLALIAFGAMIANLTITGLVGVLVPLILHSMKRDPALGSSIFVTMVGDACGFAIFLGLSTLFLQYII